MTNRHGLTSNHGIIYETVSTGPLPYILPLVILRDGDTVLPGGVRHPDIMDKPCHPRCVNNA